MKSVFIIKEEQVFENSHFSQRTGHFVYKIKIVLNTKKLAEIAKQNGYKLSLWQRLKLFGLLLLPKARQHYDIIPLKNGYDIRKS